MNWAALLCLAAGLLSADDPVGQPEGKRLPLAVGQLFVPDGYVADDNRVRLIVHLHGAPSVCEPNLIRSGSNAVLVSIALNGLSGVYAEKFAKPDAFIGLLDEVVESLGEMKIAEKPTICHLTLSSFSAGFGGVREILKSDALYRRVDSLVMADSIYAGYREQVVPPTVDPKLMEGFLRFARDAAEGHKTMVVSHCQLQPEGYASTAETADYLIKQLELTRMEAKEIWSDGWINQSVCRKRGFHVHGFSGETGQDHMQHLRHIGQLWNLAR
jgi:hypothetical protein